jgi:hypothetical protein
MAFGAAALKRTLAGADHGRIKLRGRSGGTPRCRLLGGRFLGFGLSVRLLGGLRGLGLRLSASFLRAGAGDDPAPMEDGQRQDKRRQTSLWERQHLALSLYEDSGWVALANKNCTVVSIIGKIASFTTLGILDLVCGCPIKFLKV